MILRWIACYSGDDLCDLCDKFRGARLMKAYILLRKETPNVPGPSSC